MEECQLKDKSGSNQPEKELVLLATFKTLVPKFRTNATINKDDERISQHYSSGPCKKTRFQLLLKVNSNLCLAHHAALATHPEATRD